jgi:thioredoxin-like negative regulator of GroEL
MLQGAAARPGRKVSPALEQLARDLAGKVKLVKVNVDTSPQIGGTLTRQSVAPNGGSRMLATASNCNAA